MLEGIKSLIVIVGCQRSGTTLCGQILGAHPNCILLDEPDGLYPWFDKTDDGKLDEGHALKKLLNRADQKYKPDFKRKSGSGMEAVFKPSVHHLVLKAPNLTYAAEQLANLDLPVSIIYPVRDPRAVVASMQGLDFIVEMDRRQVDWAQRFPKVAEANEPLLQRMNSETEQHTRLALVWKLKTGLLDSFHRAGLNPMVFRYEDFVTEPETYRKSMFAHCGLSFHASDPIHPEVFQGRGPGLTERGRPVDAVSLNKWKDRLSEEQALDILREAGSLAEKYDYHVDDVFEDTEAFQIKSFNAPIVLLGRGGSGTRLLSEIAQSQDIFLGNRLNQSGDSVEWVDTIYEIGARRTLPSRGHRMETSKAVDLLRGKAKTILKQAEIKQGQSWGWKLPETMLIVPDVIEAFPDAKFIHLVRHPVTSSLRRTHMTSRPDNPIGLSVLTAAYRDAGLDVGRIKTDPEYLRNAYTWLYQVKSVHQYAESFLTSDRYKLVKYEDVLSDPLKATHSVGRFIRADVTPHTLPMIENNRAAYHNHNDPRVEEAWSICGAFATTLGYTESFNI